VKIRFIAYSVSASLDRPDLVVESLSESKRDFVLQFAIGGDSVPMAIDRISELLIRLQPLRFERCAPVLEEAACPALLLVSSRVGQRAS